MRLVGEALAGRSLELLDGVKATDERGWVQVLPHPDEPSLLVFAEGDDGATSEVLAAEVAEIVAAALTTVGEGDADPRRTTEQAST